MSDNNIENQETKRIIQAKNRTISLSYTHQELEEVNVILEDFQTNSNLEFDSMKGLFLEVLRNCNVFEKLDDSESRIKDDKINELQGIISELQKQIIEIQENETVQIVEIPHELPKNSIVLKLTQEKFEVIQQISENHLNVFKHPESTCTLPMTVDKLIFNRATLFNWGGECPTGLNKNSSIFK